MRALANIHSSFLDLIENTRFGSAGFRLARFGAFALVIFVGSRVASRQFLAFDFSDILFIGITSLAFLLMSWRWEIGIIAVLGTTSFIAYYDVFPTLSLYHFIPEIPVLEQLRLLLGQGVMLFLVAVFATSLEARTARRRLATPLAPAMMIFMLAILIAAIGGFEFGGVPLPAMVAEARPYSFYLMFFATLLCLRTRRDMKILLVTSLVMALVVAVLMFVQFAAGDRFKVFLGQSVRIEVFGGYAGRILPPGTELIWAVIPFVIATIPIASHKLARLLIAALTLLLGGLLLTFTRTIWMATVFSMIVMAILGKGAVRRGVIRMFLALAVMVGILLLVLNLVSTQDENYMTPYVKRFTSIFDSKSYEEGTTADARFEEIKNAWPRIVEHPLLGVGVGGVYNYVEAWDDVAKAHYMQPVSYIHNAYFRLLTQTGAIGFVACMAVYITFFVRARKIYKKLDNLQDRAIVMAGIGTIASVMLSSTMQPSFWSPAAVPCIGIVFGLVEVTRYFRDTEREALGQPIKAVPATHPAQRKLIARASRSRLIPNAARSTVLRRAVPRN